MLKQVDYFHEVLSLVTLVHADLKHCSLYITSNKHFTLKMPLKKLYVVAGKLPFNERP